MPHWQEDITDPIEGGTLRFFWNDAGLTHVHHVKHPSKASPNATACTGELLVRFPAIQNILDGRPAAIESLSFALHGTVFQQSVWKALADIPYGTTVSYRDLAAKLGRPDAVRAVAGACGANPVPRLLPCHRVIASNGTLGGFIWGLPYKRALLAREQRNAIAHAA
jgi:O-6-methylguanine DNA methyltransferase